MKEPKFYICRHCGNIMELLHESGVPVVCCGEPMEELTANTVEASAEKHVPVVSLDGNTVNVKIGAVFHPMIPEHHIEWIYLQIEHGGLRHDLNPGENPEAVFCTNGDKPVAAYAYCNLHGLWKTVI